MKKPSQKKQSNKHQIHQNEDDSANKSLHEKLVMQYLSRSKMESSIVQGLKQSISGDAISKNPWCEIGRSLSNTNLKLDVQNNFERLSKSFKKTQVSDTGKYKIFKIDQDEPQIGIFGYEQVLEYVSLPRIQELYDAIKFIARDLEKELNQCTLKVVHSLSGGYLFRSELIQFPNSHPLDIEISTDCFIKAQNYEVSLDAFAQFIYEDTMSMSNAKDMHLIKQFVIVSIDQKTQIRTNSKWTIYDIRGNKNKFIADIVVETRERSQFYWKGYCLIKAIENESLAEPNAEGNTYQYIEVQKSYNCHIDLTKEKISYASQPLGSLAKGVFFDLNDAYFYAFQFYKENEEFTKSVGFQAFIINQLQLVNMKWKEQAICGCTWELFSMAFYIESTDLRRSLMDSIIQIISSDFSCMLGISKSIRMLQKLLLHYLDTQAEEAIPLLVGGFRVIKDTIWTLFGQGQNADILRFRQYIFRILQMLESPRTGTMAYKMKSYLMLGTMYRLIKLIGSGNLQRVAVLSKNLPQFIMDALVKNNLAVDGDLLITYENFIEMKVPKKMMHVSYETQIEKKKSTLGLKNEQDIEDSLIMIFMNNYDVYENIYAIIRDLFFDKQMPNALAQIQFQIEQLALKYQMLQMSDDDIREQMCNDLDPSQLMDMKDPEIKLYAFKNEEMEELEMKPLWGLQEVMYYTSAFEISGLKVFLENYSYTKAMKKPFPPSYSVQPIMSASTYNLFQDSTVLGRTYCEWLLNWDWVIKGPSYQHAQQIFADTLLKYIVWLELNTDVLVLGIFIKKNPHTVFISSDDIVQSQDAAIVRQKILRAFTENSRVYLQIAFQIETRFKCVKFLLNLHYVDPIVAGIQTLFQIQSSEQYFKVFFDKVDFVAWNKIYPWNKNNAIKLVRQEQEALFQDGSLNNLMKLELLKQYLTQPEEIFLNLCRVLFTYSEQFFNLSREADTFAHLFRYLGATQKTKKKILLIDMKAYFQEFSEAVQEDILATDNIYFDSIGAQILNNVGVLKRAFSSQITNYDQQVNSCLKLTQQFQIVSDSVIMTFREFIYKENGIQLFWQNIK